jgi:hypothetical protein
MNSVREQVLRIPPLMIAFGYELPCGGARTPLQFARTP